MKKNIENYYEKVDSFFDQTKLVEILGFTQNDDDCFDLKLMKSYILMRLKEIEEKPEFYQSVQKLTNYDKGIIIRCRSALKTIVISLDGHIKNPQKSSTNFRIRIQCDCSKRHIQLIVRFMVFTTKKLFQ